MGEAIVRILLENNMGYGEQSFSHSSYYVLNVCCFQNIYIFLYLSGISILDLHRIFYKNIGEFKKISLIIINCNLQ